MRAPKGRGANFRVVCASSLKLWMRSPRERLDRKEQGTRDRAGGVLEEELEEEELEQKDREAQPVTEEESRCR